MGLIKTPQPVKLFLAQLSANPEDFEQAEGFFSEKYGLIDYQSSIFPFTFTNYYKDELGENLLRKIVAFKTLIPPPELIKAKLLGQEIEAKLGEVQAGKLKRKINLDPGFLVLGKVILASTKDHQHRIYLDQGIYAEVTLRFKHKTYLPWEWTYPDYQSPEYIEIFKQIREIYYRQVSE